jgi:hypothetical protein
MKINIIQKGNKMNNINEQVSAGAGPGVKSSENVVGIKDKKPHTAEAFASKNLLDEPMAPIPMGFDTTGQHCYFWSTQENFMMSITPAELKKGERLFLLCNYWLNQHFTESRDDGSKVINIKKAGTYLLAATGEAGMQASVTDVRGCGVYFDKTIGKRVINGSTFCIDEDGQPVPRFIPGKSTVYIISKDFSPPAPVAYTTTEAMLLKARILAVLSTWGYSNRYNILIILGWLVQAAQIGARDPRPHIWINGQAGAGKTTLRTFIANITRGYVLHAASASGSTQAGIRQKIGVSATAVTIDEAETAGAGNMAAAKNMPGFMVLARSAYSSEEQDFKGTMSGDAREYTGLSSFLFCSIYPPDLNAADRSRIVQIKLEKDVVDDDGIVAESQEATGLLSLMPELREDIESNIMLTDRERAILFYEMLKMSRFFELDRQACHDIFKHYYRGINRLDARDLNTYGNLLTGGAEFIESIAEDALDCAEYDPDLQSVEKSIMRIKQVTECLQAHMQFPPEVEMIDGISSEMLLLWEEGCPSFAAQLAEVKEIRNEGASILDIILRVVLRVDWKEFTNLGCTTDSVTMSVGMLIQRLANAQDSEESKAIVNFLGNIGLVYRLEKQVPYLAIANASPQLAERLPAEWQKNKSWCTPLDLIPGVLSSEKRRIGGRPMHCRMVPLADSGLFDKEGAE